jgi:hypothetical protein
LLVADKAHHRFVLCHEEEALLVKLFLHHGLIKKVDRLLVLVIPQSFLATFASVLRVHHHLIRVSENTTFKF